MPSSRFLVSVFRYEGATKTNSEKKVVEVACGGTG